MTKVRIPGQPRPLTYAVGTRLVKAVGDCLGVSPITDDDAGYVLWNHTGFPGFFNTGPGSFKPNPVEACRHQIAQFFKEAR